MALLLLAVMANPLEQFEPAFTSGWSSLASIPRILAAIRMCPACDPEVPGGCFLWYASYGQVTQVGRRSGHPAEVVAVF